MKRQSQGPIVLVGLEKSVELMLPYSTDAPMTASPPKWTLDPTTQLAEQLARAGAHFNRTIFGTRLRPYIVTLQRARGLAGYFAARRFETRDGATVMDEIALNPDTFHSFSVTQICAVLVHEQMHALQFHYGEPSSGTYHGNQFADWMHRIGLPTSDTGAPGGRRTGVRMSHYIQPDGLFARACADLINAGSDISLVDRWAAQAAKPEADSPPSGKDRARCMAKAAGEPRFRCIPCGQSMIAS